MNRLMPTPVASTLASLAILATLVPSAFACCCFQPNSELKSFCAQGGMRKACCQERVRSAQLRFRDHEQCSCTVNGQPDCKPQCRCGLKEFVGERSPAVLANDALHAVHYLDLSWTSTVHMPLTFTDCAIAYSFKIDSVLTYEQPSAQILLGVWRN